MSISGSELLDAKTDSSIDEIAGLLEASTLSLMMMRVFFTLRKILKKSETFDLVGSGEQENSDNFQTSDEVPHEYSTSESPSDMEDFSFVG